MVTDLLFLKRFFIDPDPWRNIAAIHESVLADFAPARSLGFRLYAAEPRDAREPVQAATSSPAEPRQGLLSLFASWLQRSRQSS